jgi:hypothetical protein
VGVHSLRAVFTDSPTGVSVNDTRPAQDGWMP